MFPKTGKNLPASIQGSNAYAEAIAEALRTELGATHRATKTLMRWTGVSERTAKNWLSGRCAPRGHHLIQLTRESDIVLATVLALAGRNHHMVGARLLGMRELLIGIVQLIDDSLPSTHEHS